MKLLFSDGGSGWKSGPVQLIRLDDGWYVTGPGFMYQVDTKEEGEQLLSQLKADQQRNE